MKLNNKEKIDLQLGQLVCNPLFFRYRSGRLGFRLLEKETGSIFATCTLNLDSKINHHDDEVIIKDYSENKGMYQALLNIGFIHPYTRKIPIGFEFGLVCRVNLDYKYNN